MESELVFAEEVKEEGFEGSLEESFAISGMGLEIGKRRKIEKLI